MSPSFFKRCRASLLWFVVALAIVYGAGRLYYRVTGGFTIGNITYEIPYDSRWDIKPLSSDEQIALDNILSQKFTYLGKGCQSYVFQSDDGNYVLKFFKFQRFRPQAWLDFFAIIPAIDSYRLGKIEKKKQKLEGVFTSWKIAYEELQNETGVVFVHLNKTNHLRKQLVIYDKLGLKHVLNIDDFEFMVQKKAGMLCGVLDRLMAGGNSVEAKDLLDRLLMMVYSEYRRGLADNDHALMQNTGVLGSTPIHVDVGQFVKNERVKDAKIYNQEIFNKTWKFRKWLEQKHPELADHLVSKLKEIIGDKEFAALKPRLNKATMGVISHQE